MTDSMNAETSGGRPRQPIRPLTQATAEGPSISQDPLRENTFNAETAGGTMPQPGSRPQREGAGSAAPSSPMPGRGPRFGELGRKAKDFFLGTRKRAAATVGGTVLIGASALVAADQAGAFESNTSVPPTAGATVPGFEPNGTLPPGLTTEPATQIPTEVPATPTETATPVVIGPEHGHASIDQMEGVPAEVQAKLQEIIKRKDVDVEIIGNRVIVYKQKGYESRTECVDLKANTKSACTSLDEASMDLSTNPNAMQLMDSSVSATLNLINKTEGTTSPIVKAYDGNLEMSTGEKVIKDKAIPDINKTIILFGLMAEPEDIMFVATSANGTSYEYYELGDGWTGIVDGIYSQDLLGDVRDNDQSKKLANAVVYSLAVQSNQGFKKTPMVHGESAYSATQAETQDMARRLFPDISPSFFPDGMSKDSTLRTKGEHHP